MQFAANAVVTIELLVGGYSAEELTVVTTV